MEQTQTIKEKMWNEFKEMDEGEVINMVNLKKKIGCTLAYISSTCRFALEAGILEFDQNGGYLIKELPDYPEFNTRINERYNAYRQGTASYSNRGNGTFPRRTRTPKVPEDFKIDENTIINVIKKLINDKKELEEKLEKTIKYAKKIKKERDELVSTLID